MNTLTSSLSADLSKQYVYGILKQYLRQIGLQTGQEDFEKPWGGYFYIVKETQEKFLQLFFPEYQKQEGLEIQPKILVVAPGAKLSWQYHYRRSEIWNVVEGPVGIIRSKDDTQKGVEWFEEGKMIEISQGERHRLVGGDTWGIVAEIWQHTDSQNPSNEDDIVRLADEYGR